MHCVYGRCIKCTNFLVEGARPAHRYEELIIRLSDGSLGAVGICNECSFDACELPELTAALKESAASMGYTMQADAVEVLQRKPYPEILKEIQVNRCSVCLETLGDNYSVSNGRLTHDVCRKAVGEFSETLAGDKVEIKTARPRSDGKHGKSI